jgi:hypothetical protein
MSFSAQLCDKADEIKRVGQQLHDAFCQLDLELRQKPQVESAVWRAGRLAHTLASEATRMANYVQQKAKELEQADRQQGVGSINGAIKNPPLPVPAPTPLPEVGGREKVAGGDLAKPLQSIIDFMDDWTRPIDWIQDHTNASKLFHAMMQSLGRLLNQIGHTTGYITKFNALANLMEHGASAIGGIGDIQDLTQLTSSGKLSNAEICRTAVEAWVGQVIPLPIFPGKVADWVAKFVPDPNSKFDLGKLNIFNPPPVY